jgi:putative alpha-1,2-mannosidase
VRWLDGLFDRKLYTQGNEQDLLAPYLYIYAHRHDRVCERVRAILAKEYHDSRAGLPGNDDAGTMSSWYVWGAIGLYPNAGQPFYYIGSPLFSKTTIKVHHDKEFVIEAEENSAANIYIQRAELNGRKLERAWLSHEEIVSGGHLVLHMGSKPLGWARDGALPPTMGQASSMGESHFYRSSN